MDKKNLMKGAALFLALTFSNAATLFFGKDHVVSQVIGMMAQTGCQVMQEMEDENK